MLWFEFQARKSTQAAAFLLHLCGDAKGKYLLLKMIYLADRKALEKWNVSITGDEPYSMELGPVPSNIYDLTKGGIRHGNEWKESIETVNRDTLKLKSNPGTDELSQDEMTLLSEIFTQYKDFTFQQMKDYCHRLPEYDQTVGKSSSPIGIATMFRTLGKSVEQIRDAADSIIANEKLKAVFGE